VTRRAALAAEALVMPSRAAAHEPLLPRHA
jgi:hypothetical protein